MWPLNQNLCSASLGFRLSGVLVGLLVTFSYFHVFKRTATSEQTESANRTFYLRSIVNQSIAETIAKKVRLFCWILTSELNHKAKCPHVKATWLRRCDGYVFMSDASDTVLPAVKLPHVGVGRDWLWEKTKAAFRYVYERHLNDYDWFLKADDDTYVVVENLRYLLLPYNSSEGLAFGANMRIPGDTRREGLYMSGGAGYVLSREAVRKFIEDGLPKKNEQFFTPNEDVEIGKRLWNVNVSLADSRDALGRHKFHPETIEKHVMTSSRDHTFWFWSYAYYPLTEGISCCSDYAISWHYVKPEQMHVLDYLIYQLNPYGGKPKPTTSKAGAINETSLASLKTHTTTTKMPFDANASQTTSWATTTSSTPVG